MKLSVWLSIAAVGASIWLADALYRRLDEGAAVAGPLEAPSLRGCGTPQPWASRWAPVIVGQSDSVGASYDCNGVGLHVHVARFAGPSKGPDALSEGQRVVPNVWVEHSTSTAVTLAPGFEVTQHHLLSRGEDLVIWSWYSLGSDHYRSRLRAKLREVLDIVMLRRRPIAIHVVATDARGVDVLRDGAAEVWSWYVSELASDGGKS